MEVFDTIRTVLAVRQFQDKAIPESIVREIKDLHSPEMLHRYLLMRYSRVASLMRTCFDS